MLLSLVVVFWRERNPNSLWGDRELAYFCICKQFRKNGNSLFMGFPTNLPCKRWHIQTLSNQASNTYRPTYFMSFYYRPTYWGESETEMQKPWKWYSKVLLIGGIIRALIHAIVVEIKEGANKGSVWMKKACRAVSVPVSKSRREPGVSPPTLLP